MGNITKKEISTKLITILTVACALIALVSASFSSILSLYLSYKLNRDTSDAGAIGIIGGADGPTAIYVAGQPSLHFTAVFALLTIIGIAYLVIARYKKNHN